jgi:hypothetical protein
MPPYETNKPISVILFDVNGEPVDLGGGVGENVAVTNFPSSYPLPDAQVIALTPPAAITGFSTEAKQDDMIAELQSIAGEDFATQTTLADILAKIIAAPSTEAKQDTMITALADILAKLILAPATEAKQDDGNALLTLIEAKNFATEVTLAAILAKIIAAPATEAKQDTGNASLTVLEGVDFATQTTLAAILAKIIAAPSTEAKQDSLITLLTGVDFAMDSTLQDVFSIINKAETRTPGTPAAVTVNTSSTSVLSANANRRGLYIQNTSTSGQIITLRQGANTAVMFEGIVLYPGGTYKMEREDYHLLEIRAIASAAGGRLSIQEYT